MNSLIDSHAHLYLKDFSEDRDRVIQRAKDVDIVACLLPNIDSSSTKTLFETCRNNPGFCFPMMGLHPTSVKENFEEELLHVETMLEENLGIIAIGEIGIDLYWDKTFQKEQEQAFIHQLALAKKYNLPVVIHTRESIDLTIKLLEENWHEGLSGVFHCFSGNLNDAKKVVSLGFKLGIGGVSTFSKSNLPEIIQHISLSSLLLETDCPFLAPVPFRGKRNEPSYLPLIAQKIAELKNITLSEVAKTTTQTAIELFKLSTLGKNKDLIS